MGKFEVGHWMGTKKEEYRMRKREQKYFGLVSAFYTTHATLSSLPTIPVFIVRPKFHRGLYLIIERVATDACELEVPPF